jgi:hypothetical protein
MSQIDQIEEIEQQLRRLQLSSQEMPVKQKHEKELHVRIENLRKSNRQEFECQQAEGASDH